MEKLNFDSNTDISFTRTIKAPRALIWECWTKPDHIKQFFVPKPNWIETCEIDLRAGGRFNWTASIEGKLCENSGIYLEIVAGERLVFTDAYTEGWKPAADPFMTAIVEFADDGNGGTIYTATARHRSPEAKQKHEDMGFYEGWGMVVMQLEKYAQSLV